MGRHRNLELQRRGRDDLDFELCAHTPLHCANDMASAANASRRRR
jgi:hypothetical protein